MADEFNENFQTGILALMLKDEKFLSHACDVLDTTYFDSKAQAWLFEACKEVWEKSGAKLTERSFVDRLSVAITRKEIPETKFQLYCDTYDAVDSDTLTDAGYIHDRIAAFAARRLCQLAFLKAQKLFQEGKYKEIAGVFEDAARRADFNSEMGQFHTIENMDKRMARRKTHVNKEATISTGISQLDIYFDGGGLCKGEVALVLAPTNRGKSMFLKAVAEHNLKKGKNVLIFTLEMSEDRYLHRFDLSAAKMTAPELDACYDAKRDVLVETLSKRPGKVHVKQFPTGSVTVSRLKHYCVSMRRTGFFPDFVIIDYPALLKPEEHYSEVRFGHTEIIRAVRGWAIEDSIPIWVADQGNRASLKKDVVDLDDMSEDFGKNMIVDVVLTLCQNDKEKQEGKMRIKLAKNRDYVTDVVVSVTTHFEHGCFYLGLEDE